jgi:hypothetical protein
LLGYAIDEWIPLLKGTYPDLEISFQGHVVQNPHVFLIRFINYGKVEVRPEDFVPDEPLGIGFSDRLVDASVIIDGHGSVDAKLRKGTYGLSVQPVLINPGEQVVVSGLVDKKSAYSQHKVGGRLAGVQAVTRLDRGGSSMSFMERITAFALVGMIVLVAVAVIVSGYVINMTLFWWTLMLGMSSYLTAAATLIALHWRNKRRPRSYRGRLGS